MSTLLLGFAAAFPAFAEPARSVNVAIVFDGPWERNDEMRALFEGEIRALTAGEFDVDFRDRDVLVGDWTRESVEHAIGVLLLDPSVGLIIAAGPLSSHAFCCREVLQKPVIAALVLDATLQDLPQTDQGTSGVHNLVYISLPSTVASDLAALRSIVDFKHLTVVSNRWFADAVPKARERFEQLLAVEPGGRISLVPLGFDIDAGLAAIPADADAVYLAPLIHLSPAEQRRFFDGLTARRLPTFSLFGALDVENGALAGHRDPSFFQRLARRVALDVQRILLGEDPATLPVAFPDRQELVVNMETARAIDLYPPWSVLSDATLIAEEPALERELSLSGVVDEAIAANLDLRARGREVEAGAQTVERARSALRPQLEASATGVEIDRDRAGSTFSTQAQTTLSGGLALRQTVYSDSARTGVEIQRDLQRVREHDLESLKLDITLDAALAYLDVLRAKTVVQIRHDDLRVSRSNLELAEVRRTLGEAGPGEVYRWQSRVATARRDLIETQTLVYQAEIALNRLLHRPQEEGFRTVDVGLDDPRLITSRERLYAYTDTPRHFEAFREFMVAEGLARAPELAQLRAAIAAQERQLSAARRAFRLPEVGLQAQLERQLAESGPGSDDPDFGGLPIALELPGDTTWSLALRVSYPLWTGGRRTAEQLAAEADLARLELERDALAERLEQGIRTSLHSARASYAGLNLTREAAVAARKNLELVTDAYSRGAADVLDLLDAQSAALGAELAAADSTYVFLIALMRTQRATSQFDFFLTADAQDALLDRLDAFFQEVHLAPRPRR